MIRFLTRILIFLLILIDKILNTWVLVPYLLLTFFFIYFLPSKSALSASSYTIFVFLCTTVFLLKISTYFVTLNGQFSVLEKKFSMDIQKAFTNKMIHLFVYLLSPLLWGDEVFCAPNRSGGYDSPRSSRYYDALQSCFEKQDSGQTNTADIISTTVRTAGNVVMAGIEASERNARSSREQKNVGDELKFGHQERQQQVLADTTVKVVGSRAEQAHNKNNSPLMREQYAKEALNAARQGASALGRAQDIATDSLES